MMGHHAYMDNTTASEFFYCVFLTDDSGQQRKIYTTAIGDRATMLADARRFAHVYLDTEPAVTALTIQEFTVVPGENVSLN